MRRRLSTALVVATLAACAGQQQVVVEKPKETPAVANVPYFDVATCGPKPITVGTSVTATSLKGFLESLQPWLMECLVDEHHRGAAAHTQVTVDASVEPYDGIQPHVHSDNLTAAGFKCLQSVVDRMGKSLSVPNDGDAVHAKVQLIHDRETSPTTHLTGDVGSRFISRARLQFPQWCDCFQPWKAQAPRALESTLVLVGGKSQSVHAEVDLTNDSNSDKVAECLQHKLETVDPGIPSGEAHFTSPLFFVHSGVAESLMASPPHMKYVQLRSVLHQRAAEVAVRAGSRTQVWTQYQANVRRAAAIRKGPRPKLAEPCGEVVKTDETWVAALSRQLEAQEETVALLTELLRKDTRWSGQEQMEKSALAGVQASYEKAKALRAQDTQACEDLQS